MEVRYSLLYYNPTNKCDTISYGFQPTGVVTMAMKVLCICDLPDINLRQIPHAHACYSH